MSKRSRQDGEVSEKKFNGNGDVKKSMLVDDQAVDPTLALLFASSVGLLLCIRMCCCKNNLLIIIKGWASPSTSKIPL